MLGGLSGSNTFSSAFHNIVTKHESWLYTDTLTHIHVFSLVYAHTFGTASVLFGCTRFIPLEGSIARGFRRPQVQCRSL